MGVWELVAIFVFLLIWLRISFLCFGGILLGNSVQLLSCIFIESIFIIGRFLKFISSIVVKSLCQAKESRIVVVGRLLLL